MILHGILFTLGQSSDVESTLDSLTYLSFWKLVGPQSVPVFKRVISFF